MTRRRASSLVAALFAAAALLPVRGAGAQQAPRPYRIGAVHAAFAPNHPAVEGLRAGLKAQGLEEGRGVTLDIRFTEGSYDAFPAAAAALVRANVDVIFTLNEAATRAAMAATTTTPIVFALVGDPVAAGLVREVARPGGNVTGVSSLRTELVPKRLETLKAVAPGLRRVWFIYPADDPASVAVLQQARMAAPALKLELMARAVRTPEELARALKAVRSGDGLLAPDRTPTLDIPNQVLQTSLAARVPVIFGATFWLGFGGLISYGADYHAEGAQAARLVAKILRGARPRDLPVESANKIALGVNLKTAKAFGLTVPRAILLRADEVIQ